MYVDKTDGLCMRYKTLSRLNRTCTGKEDTFIGFRNKPEEIFSVQNRYEDTPAEPLTDAQHPLSFAPPDRGNGADL